MCIVTRRLHVAPAELSLVAATAAPRPGSVNSARSHPAGRCSRPGVDDGWVGQTRINSSVRKRRYNESVTQTYLFRIDGAAENGEFLDIARSTGCIVYSGLTLTLQHGWIPDFIEIMRTQSPASFSITVIELEANINAALAGARKYLPESSQQIVESLRQYLRRVVQRCRSTADPRTDEILQLSIALSTESRISVWAAAALRRPPQVLERLPLIDQGRIAEGSAPVTSAEPPSTSLHGIMSVSPRDHKTLSRSVLILDAIVRGWDKSDASLRAWRNHRSQPLRHQMRQQPDSCPALCALLLGQKYGVRLSIDDTARELAIVWNQFQPARHSEASVKAAISAFIAVDRTLDPAKSVRLAFEQAREVLQRVTAA